MKTKQKLLICGATGFIGRNLVEWFSRRPEFEVVAVHHRRAPYTWPNVTWARADLRDAKDVAAILAGVDIVVQAAATTSGSRTSPHAPICVTDNAVMNSLLFRAAHDQECGVVFFSCAVMLPSAKRARRSTDASGIHPSYSSAGRSSTSKMCGSTRLSVETHGHPPFQRLQPLRQVRPGRSHVFGATIARRYGRDGKIVVWGSGEGARSLYVDDLMEMVEAAIDRQASPMRCITAGMARRSRARLVRRIVTASGRELAIRHDLSSQPKTSLSWWQGGRGSAG
jgi:nucleoside-diphosphate-sugar epimerase